MALAPIAIKLGLDIPFDRVQELARCAECGTLGAHTTGPSFGGIDAGWMQFPAARASGCPFPCPLPVFGQKVAKAFLSVIYSLSPDASWRD